MRYDSSWWGSSVLRLMWQRLTSRIFCVGGGRAGGEQTGAATGVRGCAMSGVGASRPRALFRLPTVPHVLISDSVSMSRSISSRSRPPITKDSSESTPASSRLWSSVKSSKDSALSSERIVSSCLCLSLPADTLCIGIGAATDAGAGATGCGPLCELGDALDCMDAIDSGAWCATGCGAAVSVVGIAYSSSFAAKKRFTSAIVG